MKNMHINWILAALMLFCGVTTTMAQNNSSWMNLMQQTVNNSWTCEAIKRAADKSGKPLPEQCSYLNNRSSGNKSSSSSSKTSSTNNTARITGKFTPTARAESFEQIAASISDVAEERQLIAQTAAVMKSTMEEEYAARGWKNNVAGAVTFFTASMLTVYYDEEPSEDIKNAIFDVYNTAPEFASASNKDKQDLYNALITYSGMPLLFYIKGKQDGDDRTVQQAKALAKHNLKTLLKAEPESLESLMSLNAPNGVSFQVTNKPQKPETQAAASASINARYSCVRLVSKNGTTVFEPAGLGFTIAGSNYSVVSGTGGKTSTNGGITQFSGGRLNGWRGETRSNSTGTYLFFRSNFTDVRPNESAKFGDIQCYSQ